MNRIYLDNAATTPLAPEAREGMLPWLTNEYGNPSSLHADGRRAKDAIDEVREIVSQALGCMFGEVVFTSSGTEAANLAIIGAALANTDARRNRILLGAAEHHCVLHTQPILVRLGYRVELIPVDREAYVQLGFVQEMLGEDVLLVSVMHANNEIGTINSVEHIAVLAAQAGALMHVDAVQTFLAPLPSVVQCPQLLAAMPDEAKRAIVWQSKALSQIGANLVSISAHKVGGPKGIGALYQRAGITLQPLAVGGGQEREIRAGTENVSGIVGFGAAVRARNPLPLSKIPTKTGRGMIVPVEGEEAGGGGSGNSRDIFLAHLVEAGFVQTVKELGSVLKGHAHVRLPGVDAETMLIRLDRMGVSASSGSACSSGSLEPSHVLLACGYSEQEAKEGLRFTFGRESTVAEAEDAARRVIEAAESIRSQRP